MPAILAIFILLVAYELIIRIPEGIWIPFVIVAGFILAFVAIWFALAFLVQKFIKISLNIKN